MKLESINPWNLTLVEQFEAHTDEQAAALIDQSARIQQKWANTTFEHRAALMHRAAEVLLQHKHRYAQHITAEMGKPLVEAIAEVEKCAWVCRFYADNAAVFLKPKTVATDAGQSFVRHDPMGVVFAIMPWNFPFWQVFRFAAPTLMAGNTAVLKHAPNVSRCSLCIQEVFELSGFPTGAFTSLLLTNEQAAAVITHPAVRAVSLTGSERAGQAVAGIAANVLKPCVLELGGSNAVIVLADADLEQAVDVGFRARFLNAGQSCIAGKRFLVHNDIFDAYLEKFNARVRALKLGDPMDTSTRLGPMARLDLAEQLEQQVQKSVALGAKLALGGKRTGAAFEATVLTGVKPGMPAFDEELFGPVAAFVSVAGFDEAIALSNQSAYGLGVTICTSNVENALGQAHRFDEGAVFVNEIVKSDPRLPFGGVKRSGYGRELSAEGILEFVNVKTVYVK